MDSLNTLLKIIKLEIDEHKVQLNKLTNMKQQLLDYSNQIDIEVEKEYQYVSSNPEFGFNFESYLNLMKDRKKNIAEAVLACDKEVSIFEDKISDCFKTQKQYEILIEQKLQKQKEIRDKRTSERLDEVALQKFATNNEFD